MITIQVSDMEEAIAQAKSIFAETPTEALVVVEGNATVGGVMFDARERTLLLHRSGQGIWAQGNSDVALDLAIGMFLATLEK